MRFSKLAVLLGSFISLSVLGMNENSLNTNLKLYALDCGTMDVNDMEVLSSTGAFDKQKTTLVNPCFLVRHPKGDLIWDTGMNDSLADKPNGEVSGVWHSKMATKLSTQLEVLGLTAADIEYLALSHAHPDHSGNANQFAESTFIVNKREKAFMFSQQINAMFGMNYSQLKQAKTIEFENEKDVFGDGSVVIKAMPGHTPGSAVLLLRLAKAGNLLFTGDLYIHAKGRELNTMHQYNVNKKQTLESRKKFEALAVKENARVVIQHEVKDFNKLPKFPAFLN